MVTEDDQIEVVTTAARIDQVAERPHPERVAVREHIPHEVERRDLVSMRRLSLEDDPVRWQRHADLSQLRAAHLDGGEVLGARIERR